MAIIDQTRVVGRHEQSQLTSSHARGVDREIARLPECPVTIPKMFNPILKKRPVLKEGFTEKETAERK